MNGIQVLAAIAGAFALFLSVWRLPPYWRNEIKLGYDEHEPFALWLLDGASYRGFIRTTPVAIVTFVAMAAFVIAIAPEQGKGNPELTLLTAVLLGIGAVGVILAISVALFNRPKFLVVPHLRNQPGAIAEWRGAELRPIPPARSSS